ncbi:MAG TPA: hypothetical protein VLJ37_07520, partial [bacterium]|nr:hypothetical protein [bacterium]
MTKPIFNPFVAFMQDMPGIVPGGGLEQEFDFPETVDRKRGRPIVGARAVMQGDLVEDYRTPA